MIFYKRIFSFLFGYVCFYVSKAFFKKNIALKSTHKRCWDKKNNCWVFDKNDKNNRCERAIKMFDNKIYGDKIWHVSDNY